MSFSAFMFFLKSIRSDALVIYNEENTLLNKTAYGVLTSPYWPRCVIFRSNTCLCISSITKPIRSKTYAP